MPYISRNFYTISFTAPIFATSGVAMVAMDIPQIYATAAAGFFSILMVCNSRALVEQAWKYLISKYLTHPHLLHRHRLLGLWTIGPWTPAEILSQALYLTVNLFCLCFRASSISIAGVRARNLALVNLIPVSAGPHLSFLADVLGVSLSTYKTMHRSAGLMSSALTLVHVLTAVANREPFSLTELPHLFGLIVAYFHSQSYEPRLTVV